MIEQYEFLSNLCEQIRGVSYKPFECSTIPKNNYLPIYRAHNIQNDGLNENDLVYVLKDKIADYQYIKKGDIVICASSGSKDLVGKAAQSEVDCDYSFGAFCKVIRPNKNVDSKYLGFYFKSSEYRLYISSISKGSNINNLRNEDIDSIKIPFPPIEEQERIAKIIESKLTAVEKARNVVDELSSYINALPSSILRKAFNGEY
jgi:type I restriction enzyme S subunit